MNLLSWCCLFSVLQSELAIFPIIRIIGFFIYLLKSQNANVRRYSLIVGP